MVELPYWSDMAYQDIIDGTHHDYSVAPTPEPAAVAAWTEWAEAHGADNDALMRIAGNGGALVSGRYASEILGVKHGTLHVWTHRGKIAVDSYARDPFGQQCAMYRLSDVLALRDARRHATNKN